MDNLTLFWKGVILFAFGAEMFVAVIVAAFAWRDVRAMLQGLSEQDDPASAPDVQSR